MVSRASFFLTLLIIADCKHFPQQASFLGVTPPKPKATAIPGIPSVQSAGSPGEAGTPPWEPSSYIARLLGDYTILINGLPGRLTFFWVYPDLKATLQVGTQFMGREQSSLPTEDLTNIVALDHQDFITFTRPKLNQSFIGCIEIVLPPYGPYVRGIHGVVVDPKVAESYRFDAVRASDTLLSFPAGVWSILANNFPGQLSINLDQSYLTGTIVFDDKPLPASDGIPTNTIDLISVKMVRKFGGTFLTFTQPNVKRTYYAILDPTFAFLHGVYTQPNVPCFSFFLGTRDAFYFAQLQRADTPPAPNILGNWLILASRNPGTLKLDMGGVINEKTSYSAWYTDGIQPGGATTANNLTNVNIVEKYNSLFITFYRPGTSQQYYGLFEGDYTAIHGGFIGPNSNVNPGSLDLNALG